MARDAVTSILERLLATAAEAAASISDLAVRRLDQSPQTRLDVISVLHRKAINIVILLSACEAVARTDDHMT